MENSFARLGVPEQVVHALAKRQITTPFPVQSATIPDALAGMDVSGKAPTGSGKTLAFGLPVIAKVEKATKRSPRALILAPTRELAEQIKDELAPLARAASRQVSAVYGGVSYGGQRSALNRGVDILVATPGRLEDLIQQGLVSLRRVDLVVVDEADRMADMGFLPAVRRILDMTSEDRQTLLFSATLDGDVAVLIRDYQRNPVRHEAGTVEPETLDARHHFWLVNHHDRVAQTAEILERSDRSIVFTRTRHGADRLARQLSREDIKAVALHGGRSQNQRQRAIKAFSTGRAQALIATDVAARGIHIDAVETVVHYDPAADHKDYLHRSGRTARAGANGTIVSLVTGEKRKAVQRLQRDLGLDVSIEQPNIDALGSEGHGIGFEPKSARGFEGGTPKSRNRPTRGTKRSRRDAGPTPSVFIGNLPWSATGDELQALFSQHGEVLSATVIKDRRTGRSKGFGFVEMPRPDARVAIDALHGSTMGGRSLKVRIAEPRGSKR